MKNSFMYIIEDCELFIKRYDSDLDGRLSYNEFLKATITSENQRLKLDCI